MEIKFSARGTYLAGITKSGNVAIFNTTTGNLDGIIKSEDNPVRHFAMGRKDETLIATNHEYGQVNAWQIRENGSIELIKELDKEFSLAEVNLAFSCDDADVVANSYDYAYTYNIKSGLEGICNLEKNIQYMPTISFVQKGCRSVHREYPDQMARVLTKSKSNLYDLPHFSKHDVCNTYFSPSGKHIAVTWIQRFENYGMISLLDSRSKAIYWSAKASEQFIKAVAFTQDGSALVTIADDGLVKVWHTNDGRVLDAFSHNVNSVNSLTLSPNEATLIIAGKSSFEEKNLHSVNHSLNQSRLNNYFTDIIFT